MGKCLSCSDAGTPSYKSPCSECLKRSEPHWIRGKFTDDDKRYNDYSYKCSKCGRIVDFKEKFCPECGAKMDA